MGGDYWDIWEEGGENHLEIERLIPVFGACLPLKSLVEMYLILYFECNKSLKVHGIRCSTQSNFKSQ